ncbi:MAG: hypothetical protein KME03_14345 [Aphanocapsa lilacina HA4352-LM1]|nr:hypothetical protein [Aphanocapsa lilacina HA4352-LM1]
MAVCLGGPQQAVARGVATERRPVETRRVAPYTAAVGEPVSRPMLRPTPVKRFLTPLEERAFAKYKQRVRSAAGAPAADEILSPEPLAALGTSFVGLDKPGSVNNDLALDPPDPIGAKSGDTVLEATNSAIALYTESGNLFQSKDLNSFFGAPYAGGSLEGVLFDPKVYYDRNSANPRYYAVALQTDFLRFSTIWLAVSRSPEPVTLEAADWCFYPLEGEYKNAWADYPGLGAGADSLVLSANQFTYSGGLFSYAVVRVLDKLAAANNAAACPSVPVSTFQASDTFDDFNAFTLQPAQHYTSPSSQTGFTNPAYLLSTVYGFSDTYYVWQVMWQAVLRPCARWP